MTKRCVKCNKRKHEQAFGKSKTASDGLESYCKECKKENLQKWRKTKDGVISDSFNNQKQVSKRRGDNPPDYTLKQLKKWAYLDDVFLYLFDNWVFNEYDKEWKPSFDRLDDYKPYTVNNLQVTTWGENNARGNSDVKNGINLKQCKPVVRFLENEKTIYHSMNEAYRKTGFQTTKISSFVKNSTKDNKGYFWRLATKEEVNSLYYQDKE